jgi:hypothetical protein
MVKVRVNDPEGCEMPSDLTALSALAARTVVAAASGDAWAGADAWEIAKRGIARLLGCGDRAQQLVAELRLGQTRDHLQATAWHDPEQVRVEEAIWRTQLADLLEEHADKAGELRALVDQIQGKLPAGRAKAIKKADKREQWRDALQPLPKILGWYRANPVVGTLLPAVFVVIKCYVLARGDITTALGVLQYAGLATVVIAGLLSSLPILLAAMLAYTVSQMTWPLFALARSCRARTWSRIVGASPGRTPKPPALALPLLAVSLAALVLSVFFTPWTYLVIAVILGGLIGLTQEWTRRIPAKPAESRRRRGLSLLGVWFLAVVFSGVTLIAVILMLYTVWVPHEIVTFRPDTVIAGRVVPPEVGYVLSEGNGWITMLTTGRGEEHTIIRYPDTTVTAQDVCERLPSPHHSWSYFFDAVTPWRLAVGSSSGLGAAANTPCPYEGI